jgi:O-acetyl-ADP-ribose deacetylase (regulator of RNase III)
MNVAHANIIDFVENLDSEEMVVVLHVAHCHNLMRAGVALDIAEAWPEADEADKATRYGDRNKLGNWSSARVTRKGKTFEVLNLYAQYRYGPAHEKNFDIVAFEQCLKKLADYYENQNVHFVFPLMGTGTSGGRWKDNGPLVVKYLKDFKLTLVKLARR